ncbi:MAG TPA: serine/threonine-protein kinase [Ktedonobacteraceae bacterium]|nr:serine/threonine-protein kinase [Ktedonobacteraceae bacterium]
MREQHGPIKEQHGPYRGGQPGRTIGNYELESRIDAGGMGEVYVARQRTAFDRLVALKIIRPDLTHDPVARQRFLREAEVNSKLLHEHIPTLIEFNEEQGQLYFVMPYVAGGTLAQRLRAGPLSLLEVYQLFTALLSAVAYIHRHGVVHRDLKPGNILLDNEMEPEQVYVRLIDFGIASDVGHVADPRLTQAGTEMGTVAYMAPERLSGISAPSNDIYSLGVILYQMLTGHLPSAERQIALPQPLEYVINRCTAPHLEDRFRSADEILKAFEYAYQYLITQQPAQMAVSGAHSASVTGVQTQRPDAQSELVVLQQNSYIPLAPAAPDHNGFNPERDFSSPTVNIHHSAEPARHLTGTAPTGPNGPRRRNRRNPLFAIVPGFAVLVLLVMAGILFFEYQTVKLVTADISFGPQAQVVQKVFQMKASLAQTKINPSTNTIPLLSLSNTQNGSQTGATTGEQCLFVFDCTQVVAQSDVASLTAQLQQTLDKEIAQSLQQQLTATQGMQVGSIAFISASATANPPVGSPSKNVTVTINGQQGKLYYFLNSDAQTLARIMLTQDVQALGANYQLMGGSMQVGTAVVEGVDNSNNILLAVAAGAVAQYQFSAAQLHSITIGIEGMSEASALNYIKRQAGVDANTITFHLSGGSTLPTVTKNIKIITVAPTTLPTFALPTVTPAASATP